MILGQKRNSSAVHLLGIGLIASVRAQARLNVADRDPGIIGRKRSGKGRGGVSLNQNKIGILGTQDLVRSAQDPCRKSGVPLPRSHTVQIKIRVNVKGAQGTIEHRTVLTCRTDQHLNLPSSFQFLHQWAKLDRLGTSPHDYHNTLHSLPSYRLVSITLREKKRF
ncbi:MAG: hypothetical protein II326_02210 [Clostridia bacterium]|nr:hypothetical protein [Clostridia bacterium]